MIGCDNESCSIQWFHQECVQMSSVLHCTVSIHVSCFNCKLPSGHASRQKFLWFSVTSSIELFSAHKGHFTSTMPRPQHSHSIKPSGEAPKKGAQH